MKIETTAVEKEQSIKLNFLFFQFFILYYSSLKISDSIRNLKNSIAAINPNEDQLIVTKSLQKENPPFPKEAEIESPNLSNLKFDEMTIGVPTPTTPRKNLVSSQAIDVDQTQGTMRRSYNRLVEPIPPRSSLRQKKLEEFYSMSGSFLQKTHNYGIRLVNGKRELNYFYRRSPKVNKHRRSKFDRRFTWRLSRSFW